MQRIRLTVRYDGTDYAGSQAQPGRRTVESTLKAELESIYGAGLKLVFASRTDRGVHADGNVCAFDVAASSIPASRLPRVLRPRLPADLEVRAAAECSPEFHPRFDALSRTYMYRLYLDDDIPVDRRRYCAPYRRSLDRQRLQEALGTIAGRHSFERFSASGFAPEQSICTVHDALAEWAAPELTITLRANRFLRHMVCRVVAAVLAVADGSQPPASLEALFAGKMDFRLRPAPARGLTLKSVEYRD